MAAGLSGIIARAAEVARKRRQEPSTAHVLLALYQQDGQSAELLSQQGLSEVGLLGTLSQVHDERHNGVELALERAKKLAMQQAAQPCGVHLLLAIAGEPRSAGATALGRVGVEPARLCAQAGALLMQTVGEKAAPRTQTAGRPRSDAEAHAPTRTRLPATRSHERPARPRRDRDFQSAALAEHTEAKLSRRAQQLGEPASPPSAASQSQPVRPAPRVRPVRPARGHLTNARLTPASPAATEKPAAKASSPRYALDPERFPLLTSLGRNLTALAEAGQIDPVIGRQDVIEMLLDVLARRRGNSPVIVGAPGVGKTAVVEGLALALVHDADAELRERILLEISASGLLAGTGVRGALSERVQALKREVLAAEGRVLLFIDEIHGVLSGGEGGESLGNELKTALCRGELPVIGATTDAEYRRIFERDAALSRRFTRIEVGEPSRPDAVRILQGVASRYAAHHGVRYEPSALSAAVEMSVRYLPLRQLPDKAIALLDQAGARAHRRKLSVVDEAGVAAVVSELSGVPVARLLLQDCDALLQLEAHLAERIVGQREAIGSIANALRKSAAGFRGARPLGTFLFLGPTGVGKTEMAKAMADLMFPGSTLTRIDMSELGESHAVARLLGAPPGYLGHDDGGQLTEAVRHRPYQLILLDEIEKAHPEVLLSLLPLLDEGRLTDGRGRTVDFTNTVIVMTSNLGAASSAARARIGFGGESAEAPVDLGAQTRALAAARAALAPELWNRIDEPLYFHPLSESDVATIARRMLGDVAKVVLERHRVVLRVESSAIDALIAAGGFDRALGARPMRRTISRLVEAPLARALLAHELAEGAQVVLKGVGDEVRISCENLADSAAE